MQTPYDPAPVREWAARNPVNTLPKLFKQALEQHKAGPRPFLGRKEAAGYTYLTYDQVYNQIQAFASALISLGIAPGDRVAQLSSNRPEWVVTDFGCAFAAAVHVPLYPTLSPEGVEYILRDSGSRVAVVSTPQQLESILAATETVLEHVVCHFQPSARESVRLWTFEEFLQQGTTHPQADEIAKRCQALQSTDVASLVYTSGTTGDPKGAMLMHGNFASNAHACAPMLGATSKDLELSFLPLSHAFERVVYYCMVSAGAGIAYAESFDTVGANMKEVRPTMVPSVPRVFEKILARIVSKMEKAHPARRALFEWAVNVGKQHWRAKSQGRASNLLKLQYAAAHKLVLGKIKQETGGRIRLFVSGGAALRKEVGEFFLGAGYMLAEGYGLTETSPVISIPPLGKTRLGTVGKPLPDVHVRLASDGEILVKGPNIMLGYFNKPEATAEAIDSEGWFATGDIGQIEDGYLAITDRKKDLLVMSNGKNVAPQPIEQKVQSSPFIEQVVVLGDAKKFVAALIVPTYANLKDWQLTPEQFAQDPKFKEFMEAEVTRLCADFSPYEQIKGIAILPRELSQEQGELTPKLSIKRKIVNQHFADAVASLYPED